MNLNRKLSWLLLLFTALIVSSELFTRYYLGLGTPPLSIEDPDLEYMFKPNQDVNRFGNRIIINQYGMRSASFPPESTESELRIMVFGDSVLNGGSLTDHNNLATTRLQEELSNTTNKTVVVGNISAGSWGPGNWLAYVEKYGFLDADIIVLVISSHDYADNPKFLPLNPKTHPTQQPVSALTELLTRYLPRYLPSLNFSSENTNKSEPEPLADVAQEEVDQGISDLSEFLTLATSQSQSVPVIVIQHWEKEETESGHAKDGHQVIYDLCTMFNIQPIQLDPYFSNSIRQGNNPYRDNIHPNDIGQELIAEALFEAIVPLLSNP